MDTDFTLEALEWHALLYSSGVGSTFFLSGHFCWHRRDEVFLQSLDRWKLERLLPFWARCRRQRARDFFGLWLCERLQRRPMGQMKPPEALQRELSAGIAGFLATHFYKTLRPHPERGLATEEIIFLP